jgi:hypothetical protein
MPSSDTEDIPRSRTISLEGSDNFKEWLRYIRNLLTSKDIFNVADGSERSRQIRTLTSLRHGGSPTRRH